ncbi:unnamed protein product, partial [Medioppia subpectinata]
MIRASYLSNKTSMDLSGDKMSALLHITLDVFGRLLELSTIKFISKFAEEILYYLKIVFTIEPSLAVKNVRQLLKCIFGTNFVIMFTNNHKSDENEVPEEEPVANESSTPQRNPFTNGIPNYSETDGLYNTCLSSPYAKFTQFYASMSSRNSSSFGSNDEIDPTFCGWLRKKIEKRVSFILDKNISSGQSSSGLNSKASLTSHIRLFEPVVIKALKQYTITSDIQLQCEVLDLLSQLVQLRVNYCLLDSEQIFIGFVLKQFEFIESGHFDRYDRLIGHIFFFLILLSYERYHSKPIIGIPKIIQLCDGMLASGQYPQKFALPSLQPIVEDLILLRNASKVDSSKELEAQREVVVANYLILLRNASKVDSSKELEAQREVVVANCLKLVQFPEILQILVIVTKQSKKDGEEKWKKISRQITDILLPQLVRQSIQIDSYEALEQLHQLFECVSPSVFRPVDILLKALFAAPQPDIIDNYYYFHRWTSLILVILRIVIVQVKEEVVLARLQDMRSSIVTVGPFGLPKRFHDFRVGGHVCRISAANNRVMQSFALPSLQPIVEDLILLRNASKVDSSKELEAQREVVVANCLKLVQFPEILQILVIVTKQSKKDGEEKWKKISRQITDILLPQLVRQSIQIDSYEALEQLHQLFECVSPSVFRPVDILLKALFAAPQPDIIDNYYYFHRWTSLILVILRIVIVQVKEEVVLARLQDMRSSIVTVGPFGLPVIPTSAFTSTNAIPFHMSSISNRNDSMTLESEDMFAEYLLQIIELCSHEISIRINTIYEDIRAHCDFLIQQLANYMLILTHMFQSGSFRRVAKAAMNLIKKYEFDECSERNSYLSGFSLQKTNTSFLSIMSNCPTLALQWFNLLMLLNYEDNNEDGLWNQLIRPNHNGLSSSNSKLQTNGKRRGSVNNKNKNVFVFSPTVEIIRRGSLILFCDFVCENMNDAEHMTWLIVQNINQIIKLCHELPVSEFICAIHRNSASSGLFIQAINARCDDNLRIGSFCRRLLHCLGRVHPTQSVSLITFLIEKIIANPSLQSNYLFMSEAENLVIKRLNSMTSSLESYSNQSANQLTAQDLDKLLLSLNPYRYSKLISCLESFKTKSNDEKSIQTSHPLSDSSVMDEIPELNKDWFLTVLNKYCQKHSKSHRAAHLLNKLSYEDIVSILSSKEFALELLGDCIAFGDQIIEEDDKSNTKIMFSAVMNRINLLKASLNAVLQHVSYFVSILPAPHFAFLTHSEMSTPKEARHRDKLIELFSQSNIWNYLFKLSNGFLAFLDHHSERSIATDLLANIVRVTVLYAEALQYMTEAIENVSFTHIIIVLRIMKSALNCNSIFSNLSTQELISYQCSIISAVHSFTQLFFGELPKVEEPQSFGTSEKENPEWKHPHRACIRLAQLVCFLENDKHDFRRVPPVMRNLLKKVILLTARLPLVNSFVMVPISVWNIKTESVWNPVFSGDFGTIVPTIPSEFLHYKDILNQFCYRVMSLGWICRVQFEEIWMTLLGVLGANSAYVESTEDQSDRINICIITTKAITELLLLSTLSPQPGNPIKSRFIYQKNEKMATFLHSIHGVKLQLVREPLISAISSMASTNDESLHNIYEIGQISIQLMRHSIKSLNPNELSPSLSSTSSSSDYSPLSPVNGSNIGKNMTSNHDKLDIDLNSCLHFLLDLFVLLSDLFTERIQYEWLLDTFLELHRMAQISEDEIMSQYLIVGICKSSAVLGLENEQIVDKCKKCIEVSLKSHYLPTRIATIHGLKYILEFRGIGSNGREAAFLPIASDYLIKHLSDNNLPSSHNSEHVQHMWKLAFHLIEFFLEDLSDSEFGQKIFQLSLKVLTDKNSKVYPIVVNGLENLILSEKFAIKESNLIVKSALDRFKSSNCQLDALLAFQLILSATYFVGSVGLDLEKNMDDSEEFLLAMEKLAVIFERLKTCLSYEAQQICNVLPHFLCEFFPTQDILNKCIGEFLSGQQTHAKHLANILYVVFNKLQTESRLDIVHDWVILSLSSFTQLSPICAAIWSLTSFLISASVNPWIRCAFAYNQTRFGLLEDDDRQLFFIVCYNFYNELKSEPNREAFRTTFQSVGEPDSPYSQCCGDQTSRVDQLMELMELENIVANTVYLKARE